MDKRIGFIGLGIMGRPMALNLIRAGYELLFHGRNDRTTAFANATGMKCFQSVAELVGNCDVVISMLPDSQQVFEVSQTGLLVGAKPGSLYIDMSTIDAQVIRDIGEKLAKKGISVLDAPVSGGELAAKEAKLSIMVGGSQIDYQRAFPILKELGQRISLMGDLGAGQVTKSCNQIATALATQGVAEALYMAKKAGLDPAKVREAMSGGFASSRVLDIVGGRIIDQYFEAGFKINLYRKDLRIALQLADELKLETPGAELVAKEMDELIEQGLGELDFSKLGASLKEKN